jgi:hypothetical protein
MFSRIVQSRRKGHLQTHLDADLEEPTSNADPERQLLLPPLEDRAGEVEVKEYLAM